MEYFLSMDPVSLLDASVVKNPSAMQETRVQCQEDPLEKEIATHYILAWEIPRTEKLGGPYQRNRVAKSQTQLSNLTTTATCGPATPFPGLGFFVFFFYRVF